METSETPRAHIGRLREWMRRQGLEAFVVPTADPHMSEYTAEHWQSRRWLTGFTGSAGTAVVTAAGAAGLWTDSRYFLQAEEQLRGSGCRLYKMRLEGTPSVGEFLRDSLDAGSTVGFDGRLFAAAEIEDLRSILGAKHIEMRSTPDPMDDIWDGRPAMPTGAAYVLDTKYAGLSATDKLGLIRRALRCAGGCSGIWVSALDEIAWTLNLRGSDVHCNPVVTSHLYIGENSAVLFVDPRKVDGRVSAHLAAAGVDVRPYCAAEAYLQQELNGVLIVMDPAKTSYAICHARQDNRMAAADNPIPLLKAVKNAVETDGLRRAMTRDGVALVRFQMWLEEAMQTRRTVTETDIARRLRELRSEQPLYIGESFDTIAGYGAHGAIVHYEATAQSDVPLEPRGFVLIDSGAQYLDGTTDITRTIALGPLTDEERTDYTLVLKGCIDLAMAVFPEGTRGDQIDVLARLPLWEQRMNYLHGTGHGVGSFLNVHEGPQSIRMEHNPVALAAGMVTSDEPGLYKDGSHGIRTENLLLTVPVGDGMFGRYLGFETLTLCPIDTAPVRKELLDSAETAWLNSYHKTVCDRLSPHLDAAERRWLAEATRAL